MSDNDSFGTPPSRSSGTNRDRPRHFLPADFPLRTDRLATDSISILDLLAPLNATAADIDIDRTEDGRAEELPQDLHMRRALALQRQAMARAGMTQQPQKKPITTLVSTLPETTYKDQDDTKGTERTLAYIKVQRTLLKYLGVQAADTLSPAQARSWTQAIEPNTKRPKAADALRLCYYMRSQGFDTYTSIKHGVIRLFVANQKSNVRDANHDFLYWRQNYKTNFIEYTAPSTGPVAPHVGRRNALAAVGLRAPQRPDFEGLLAQLLVGSGIPPAEGREEAAGADEGGNEAGAQHTSGLSNAQAHGTTFTMGLTEAESTLHDILNSGDQDPASIEAVIAQVEELRQLLGRV